jgi:hypothetical protein
MVLVSKPELDERLIPARPLCRSPEARRSALANPTGRPQLALTNEEYFWLV